MTRLVTPAEMRAAEAAAVAAGTPEPRLMRRAAEAIAGWLAERFRHASAPHVIALVGPGNNGGDALVTLALLAARGWQASAVLLDRPALGDLPAAPENLARIHLVPASALTQADVILDGVFGIGGRAELPASVADAFRLATRVRRERGTPLVAIDVPSGGHAGSGAVAPDVFPADVTLCLGLPKIGLLREPLASAVGELIVLDIGIPEPAADDAPRLIDERLARALVPRRAASAHKHGVGSLLVVGGAPTYYGAPRLAGEAALRSGAGLVALAVPEPLVPVIAGQVPELVFVPLGVQPPALDSIDAFLGSRGETVRAAIVGPGLGSGSEAERLLSGLLDATKGGGSLGRRPIVIDADGLNWMARLGHPPRALETGQAVLTPHPGELARLLGCGTSDILADPWGMARRLARESGQVVVLKTGYSCVAAPDGALWLAPRTMPEMATAGTGDVLAGTIGGFLAQGLAPFDAARLAVYCGAMAGRNARERLGTLPVVASDIIHALPEAIRRLAEPRWPDTGSR